MKRGRAKSKTGRDTKTKPHPAPPPELGTAVDDAVAAQDRGDLEAAERGFRAILAIAPHHLEALMRLGDTLAAQGRAREAVEFLVKATAAGAHLPGLHTRVGATYSTIGRWEDAIRSFEAAATLSPNEAIAWTNLGVALVEVGRLAQARAVLQRAVLVEPLFVEGWLHLGRAVFDDKDLAPAIDALTRGLVSNGEHWSVRFSLAVALELAGDTRAAGQQFANLRPAKEWHVSAVDSFRYALDHRTPETRFFMSTRSSMVHALGAATIDGLSVELGVRHGVTAKWFTEIDPKRVLHGFDSFWGLPESWHSVAQGTYSTHGELPEVPSTIVLHAGLFDDTLPVFVREHPGKVRFIHVDCDLESSTRAALTILAEGVVPGTVILFDEYLMRAHWREDEHLALERVASARGWKFEYISFSLFTGQAAIRIVG